ncbi:MAG TPA: type II toxin-antitoxin system prevent-host-death family antitoxin [Candidatus Binatia bacterium]|jgi:prevent-host-death family protein|nr:type II toxin-antitoxin system prevent-host-death family antitoxin [Candidatus Binatia bacterium]
MITVGVRELKNKLSQYLRDVKKGKPITITERGQSVAILIPADIHPDAKVARELSQKGIGSWKGGKPKGASRPVIVKGKPISKIVLEERR